MCPQHLPSATSAPAGRHVTSRPIPNGHAEFDCPESSKEYEKSGDAQRCVADGIRDPVAGEAEAEQHHGHSSKKS
jgi:hypothetical protein